VEFLNNAKLAQNKSERELLIRDGLKRLNKENEAEPEPLNPGRLKLLNSEKLA
jgi:hypothetical protein